MGVVCVSALINIGTATTTKAATETAVRNHVNICVRALLLLQLQLAHQQNTSSCSRLVVGAHSRKQQASLTTGRGNTVRRQTSRRRRVEEVGVELFASCMAH